MAEATVSQPPVTTTDAPSVATNGAGPETDPTAASTPALPPVALYIGDLSRDVTEGNLTDFFSQAEGLVSTRLCHDVHTRSSLGYGYVNFRTTEEASKAIQKFNHMPLNGKPVRIMFSCRDPDARKNGIGNLFVKNLVDAIDNVKLQEIFTKFGPILSCKVVTYTDGRSKGYGFVQFETQESANSAIEELNGAVIGGKKIYIAKFVKKSDRALPIHDGKFTNLYMKNLDEDITEELLRLKFAEFGKITSLAIAKNPAGNSLGYAFVNFENPDDAKRAMEKMHGLQLGSRALYVARAQKKSERIQVLSRLYEERKNELVRRSMGLNVYVKNIADDVDDHLLREHFSACGTITSAKVMRDDKGISKGFGFVCFSRQDEASEAVKALHGHMFHGKPLYVAIAQRKEDRQAQLQLKFSQRMAGLVGSSAAVIPPVYPVFCPPGMMQQFQPRQGFTYPSYGMRATWRPNGFVPPARPAFQPVALSSIPNTSRNNRQNRGRFNGRMHAQDTSSMSFVPHFQQINHVNPSKISSDRQRAEPSKYVFNSRDQDGNNEMVVSPNNASKEQEHDFLSSVLSASTPEIQKQLLGERLYPLVHKQKADLAAKITGMLLEMDNSELLLLLESPESLSNKVEEAVRVLKRSNTTAGSEEAMQSKFLSAEIVAVN